MHLKCIIKTSVMNMTQKLKGDQFKTCPGIDSFQRNP